MKNIIFISQTRHYYGDIVRGLFLAGAIIMLLGLPVISNYLNISTFFSVLGILILGLSAGLTNPKQIWDAGINLVIAVVAFLIFESYAVSAYSQHGLNDKFFVANMALGLIFLLAVYFSIKTFRGLILAKRDEERKELYGKP